MTDSPDDLLRQQIEYYRARAGEYDQWFLRQGRYDRGPEHSQAWFAEVDTVVAALNAAQPAGDVLELACGTGLWTRHLLARASHLTAVDAAPEVLQLNRSRLQDPADLRVAFVEADLFAWRPQRTYDFVFFGFWLSHVPMARFDDFWRLVRAGLAPGGTAFFVDSAFDRESTATDHELKSPDDEVVERKLNDGRRFQVVKLFHDPADLAARLSALGFQSELRQTERFFIYGKVWLA